MSRPNLPLEEELRVLDFKLGQLRRDYDQYFLGTRPREPVLLRGEVNKTIVKLTNTPIQNTALRFKFSSLCSRFQAFRRRWDETLRQIEAGTYERHRFRARFHSGPGGAGSGASGSSGAETSSEDLYQSYIDARLACGDSVEGFTRAKLERVLDRQRAQLAEKYGSDSGFSFRVEVTRGKVRLKARREQGR